MSSKRLCHRNLLVRTVLFAAAVTALPSAAAFAQPLPDSVVVRFPHRDLTILDVQTAWFRQAARYRPQGDPMQVRRTFVDQLIEREALAQAALAEPFVATEAESARYLTDRTRLLSQTLYSRMVFDSLEIRSEDWAKAREALSGGMNATAGAMADTVGLTAQAKQIAARRREEVLIGQIRADLAAQWDDSVAAFLAREFAKLPPLRQQRGGEFVMRVTNQVPAIAPEDSGRVLVTAKGDRITVAGFLLRFQGIPPTEREYPVTPGEVRARGEQFLGATWFLNEAIARGMADDPVVVKALAERREGFALDHWYAKHIAPAADTSEAKLRAYYDQDPAPYAIPPHRTVHLTYRPDSLAADSLVAILNAGTRWNDWCAERFEAGRGRDGCTNPRTIFDSDPDSAQVRRLAALKPSETWVRRMSAAPGSVWEVGQLIERVEGRLRSFDEARTFVVRALTADQVEKRLQSVLVELKQKTPARLNDAALARLELGPATGAIP